MNTRRHEKLTVETGIFLWDDGAEDAKQVLRAARQIGQNGEYVPVFKIKEWWESGGRSPKLDIGICYALDADWLELKITENEVRVTGSAPQ